MAIKLSHIGETLIKALAKDDLDRFYINCGLKRPPEVDWEIKTELKLASWRGRGFDPVSRVDLGIRVGQSLVTPVEIKMGLKGLESKKVNKMLGSWSPSAHGDPRWKGKMIAFLDRHYPEMDSPTGRVPEELSVVFGDATLKLTKDWIVIARRKVIESWKANSPGFLNARFVVFEELAESFGEQRFNSLVSALFPINFYQEWVNPAKNPCLFTSL